ncbi:ribonuclease H-like isoform X1 [Hylaeus volcanicus]|uniref:ribonuclease H-like isoform X1 n=1 Tax=Hylaeus volcanicus TaxID=313075 RepID=UPI0023B806BD|nr:ribonuclease H-like isoform X1 [Hylaeus volcanicus]
MSFSPQTVVSHPRDTRKSVDYYYAVAFSPNLNGCAIFKNWNAASSSCIDSRTGRPFPNVRFQKFKTLNEANSFVDRYKRCEKKKPIQFSTDTVQRKRTSELIHVNESKRIKKSLGSESLQENGTKQNVTKTDDFVHIYTDGACLNNGKPGAKGGYGIYFGKDDCRNKCGPLPKNHLPHTNQRAELLAILLALRTVQKDTRCVVIHSDSKYCLQCIETWLPKWEENGFLTSKKTGVKNLDLIQEIDSLIKKRGNSKFFFQFVRGHKGNVGNEAADKLAHKGALMA